MMCSVLILYGIVFKSYFKIVHKFRIQELHEIGVQSPKIVNEYKKFHFITNH